MIRDITELDFPSYATLDSATVERKDMAESVITTTLHIDGNIAPDFSRDWTLWHDNARYVTELREPQATKENTSMDSSVELTFRLWPERELKRWYFFTVQPVESGTAIPDKYNASVKLNLADFCNLFSQVLKYYYGDKIKIQLNPAWEYDPEPVMVEIQNSYCWDVLIELYTLYGVRWEIVSDATTLIEAGNENYIIKVGYPSGDVTNILEYGFKGGLLSVERQPQNENIRNLLIGRGGEKNLPARYYKDSDPDNPTFTKDPDWIPELKDIYFAEMRGATFRSYIQGWKAKHYADGECGEITVPSSNKAYSPWAWMRGYTDEKFNPVEFTADGFTVLNNGYGVLAGSSIEKYGEFMGGLDNNEDYYPTLQGVRSGDHLNFFGSDFGRVDEAVWVEQITVDEPYSSSESDAVKTILPAMQSQEITLNSNERKEIVFYGALFDVPEGKKGDIDEGKKEVEVYSGSTRIEDAAVELETVSLDVINYLTNTPLSASGIPAGRYEPRLRISLHNTKLTTVRVKIKCPEPVLITANPDNYYDAFDILVKNLWGTHKNPGETDTEYASRVWTPILGNKEGEEAKVVFSDGELAASDDYEFTIVGFPVHEEKECVWEEMSGGVPVTHRYTSHWRIRLARSNADYDTLGVMVPGKQRNGHAGDHFFFIGIELPYAYWLWAEERLDDWKQDQTVLQGSPQPSWVVKLDPVRLEQLLPGEQKTLLSQLRAGKSVVLQDRRFIPGSHQETLYIQSVTTTYNAPSEKDAALTPDVEIVLGTDYEVSANPVDVVQGEVNALREQIGSLSNISQYVRKIGDKTYLRKDRNDSTPYQLGVGSVKTNNFIQGIFGGKGARIDEHGNAEFESAVVRTALTVMELIINRQSVMGGDSIFSEGGTIESARFLSSNADGTQVWEVTLTEQYEGEIPEIKPGMVVRGVVNNLFDAHIEGEPKEFYTSWMRVNQIGTAGRALNVTLYPDSMVPAQKNYPPCELMKLARWGDEADETFQRLFHLSSHEGRLVRYEGVDKPIIDKGNIASLIGRCPDWLADLVPTVEEGDEVAYFRTLIGNFIQLNHQGKPIAEIVDTGMFDPDRVYRHDGFDTEERRYVTEDVWYMGCRWRCMVDGLQGVTPGYKTIGWAFVSGNPEFKVDFEEKFIAYDETQLDHFGATLTLVATLYNQDVLPFIAANDIVWGRESYDANGSLRAASDMAWKPQTDNGNKRLLLSKTDFSYNGTPISRIIFYAKVTLDDTNVQTVGTEFNLN